MIEMFPMNETIRLSADLRNPDSQISKQCIEAEIITVNIPYLWRMRNIKG